MKSINIFKIYDGLFSILLIALPFSNSITNICIIILALIYFIKFDKKTVTKWYNSPFLILTGAVFYVYIQAIFNGTFNQDATLYTRFGYLILIPFLIFKISNKQIVKLVAITTINLTILLSLYKIGKFYSLFHFLPLVDDWATNVVLVLERPYAGIFSIICIVLSMEQIILKTRFRFAFIVSLALSVFFMFFISIRISILTLIALTIIYGIFYLKISIKKKLLFFSSSAVLLVLVVLINPNISKRFFIDKNAKNSVEQFKEKEPRIIIWNCAYQVSQQTDFSLLFGTSSYTNIKESMVKCYENAPIDYYYKQRFLTRKFNTHNQYLDFYLIGGISLLLFLFTFLFSYIIKGKSNFYTIAIIISFVIMMSVENIFHRQFGCLIFTIFTALYIENKNPQCQN